MNRRTRIYPSNWILLVSVIIAIMEIMVSMALCFSPKSVLEHADLKAEGVRYLFYIWSSRQFALGIMFAYASIKRSFGMLTLAYIFFLVMFIGDLLIGFATNETSMIIAAAVMCVISLVMLYALKKKRRR